IVRVNDRGPFHGDRIIDLTYAAAKKLGFEKMGTAEVLVEYIDPATYTQAGAATTQEVKLASMAGAAEPPAPAPANSAGYSIPENTYLQVGAFTVEKSALALRR